MQLKLTTDYAIRTVVYLATQSGITSVAEIGSKMGISENYLMKVLKICCLPKLSGLKTFSEAWNLKYDVIFVNCN